MWSEMKEEELSRQSDLQLLKNVHDSILELKKWFLLSAELKWQGKLPLNLVDDDILSAYSEVEGQIGRLRMWRHTTAYLFEFETSEGKSFSTRRPLGENVEEGYNDYEELLFYTWPYDGVRSKWKHDEDATFERELPEWHIIDPSSAATFEHFACETEKHLSHLMRDNKYKVLVEKAKNTIRNGLPKWQPCIVQWTYIKDLDEIIKEIETAIDIIKYDHDNKTDSTNKIVEKTIEEKKEEAKINGEGGKKKEEKDVNIQRATEEKIKPEKIVIDLNNFNKSGSKELLRDLILTPRVNIDEKKYGKQQPKRLRAVLRDNGNDKVAQHICKKDKIIYVDEEEVTLKAKI